MGAARSGARGRGRPAPGDAPAPQRAAASAVPLRRCRACDRELKAPADVGWECECGVVVCADPGCFAEYFKMVADGEATRCLTCGLLT